MKSIHGNDIINLDNWTYIEPIMHQEKFNKISQSQKERVFHIDFRLFFLGTITRNDLVSRFGIKEAAATRDIALYRDIAVENLEYSAVAKMYFRSDSFTPLFPHSAQHALLALTTGVGDDQVHPQNALVSCNTPPELSTPDVDVLAALSSAIHQERSVEIEYHSTSSGRTNRTIIPFSLVSNGLRWHVRAFDRQRNDFRDFVLTRIDSATLGENNVSSSERKESDNQWNRIVELELVPHPNLNHPDTIARDYKMNNGVLRLQVRAAVSGYLLRRWNVDCSPDHSLKGPEYQLWLANNPTLYGVNSAPLAPGYKTAEA